jgi:hypothetical protein
VILYQETYRTTQRNTKVTDRSGKNAKTTSTTKTYCGAPPPLPHCSPGTEGDPWRTGSRQNSAQRNLHLASPSPSSTWYTTTFTYTNSGQIRRPAASGSGEIEATEALDRRQNSGERRHRREEPPPAKPIRPRRFHPDAAGWTPYASLLYLHGAKRGSPALPPPERPTEAEGPVESAPAKWFAYGISQITSHYCGLWTGRDLVYELCKKTK